jgi:hypothetical protein
VVQDEMLMAGRVEDALDGEETGWRETQGARGSMRTATTRATVMFALNRLFM